MRFNDYTMSCRCSNPKCTNSSITSNFCGTSMNLRELCAKMRSVMKKCNRPNCDGTIRVTSANVKKINIFMQSNMYRGILKCESGNCVGVWDTVESFPYGTSNIYEAMLKNTTCPLCGGKKIGIKELRRIKDSYW